MSLSLQYSILIISGMIFSLFWVYAEWRLADTQYKTLLQLYYIYTVVWRIRS